MSDTKHTQGEWKAVKDTDGMWGVSMNTDAITNLPKENQEANAKLIAAAPEMLKRLQQILRKTNGMGMTKTERLQQIEGMARKVIEKATS